ncbi:hypothetical protein A2U01_0095622, partial [Trifolium medium]|nr:hypothetical protein [Trifolium medium]
MGGATSLVLVQQGKVRCLAWLLQ